MIGHYHMSRIGSSHRSAGGVCQDASDVKTLENGWVIAAIADGLGSAKHSDVGSRLAVREVISFAENYMPCCWHDDSLISMLRTAYHSALKKIEEEAKKHGNPGMDYDTTLTSLVYNGSNVVFGHVGDGGIIALDQYGEFSRLTTAQRGEECNSVVPLRSGPDNWVFGVSSDESVCALLMLTDGLYDVACPWLIAKEKQNIYLKFVRPFMDRNILPVETPADFEEVREKIEESLSVDYPSVTDDITIVGIINTDVMPEVKDYEEPDLGSFAQKHKEKLYNHEVQRNPFMDTPASEEPTNANFGENVDVIGGKNAKTETASRKVNTSAQEKNDASTIKNTPINSGERWKRIWSYFGK